jgi:hypothetical protein
VTDHEPHPHHPQDRHHAQYEALGHEPPEAKCFQIPHGQGMDIPHSAGERNESEDRDDRVHEHRMIATEEGFGPVTAK